jgi:hypothetical protein
MFNFNRKKAPAVIPAPTLVEIKEYNANLLEIQKKIKLELEGNTYKYVASTEFELPNNGYITDEYLQSLGMTPVGKPLPTPININVLGGVGTVWAGSTLTIICQ